MKRIAKIINGEEETRLILNRSKQKKVSKEVIELNAIGNSAVCCQIMVVNSTCKSVFILNIQHTEILAEAKSTKTILSYSW